MLGQSGRLSVNHLSLVLFAASLWCMAAASAATANTSCEHRASTLGWASGCGCLKHDPTQIVRALPYVLPGCGREQHEAMARQLVDGFLESDVHDERKWLCAVTCGSMDWPSINDTVDRHDGEEPI